MTPKEPIKFLVLSRVDSAKGRDLAIKIVQEVRDRGIERSLRLQEQKKLNTKPQKDWIKSPDGFLKKREMKSCTRPI